MVVSLEKSTCTAEGVPTLNFTDCDDVDECFSHFTAAMFKILSKAEFPLLRRACLENINTVGGVKLPDNLKDNIKATQNLNDLFDELCGTPYWNWMNIKMLTKMEKASHLPAATELIRQYKEEVFSRKLIEVLQQLPSCDSSSNYYTKAKEKWNKDLNDVTVNDLVNHWSEVEKIFNVEEPTVLLDKVINGSIEIHWLIPTELVEHTRQSVGNHISIMLRCNILYFDIGGHVINLQPDAPTTASSTGMSIIYICIHVAIIYSTYVLCIFIAELSLAATSSTTVDLPTKVTHSITKLSVGKSSSHTGHGSTSYSLTKVSKFLVIAVYLTVLYHHITEITLAFKLLAT